VDLCAQTETVTAVPARWLRSLVTLAALMLGLLTWTEDADARLEDGLHFAGNRIVVSAGSRLVSLDNSMFPSAAQPTYPGGSLGGLFNRPGLVGGFAAGFLGSGLLGLLFGHGMVGELGSVASVLGLAFQFALIVMLARLIWTWWNIDQTDAHAGLSPRQLADAYGRPRNEVLPDADAMASAEAIFREPADDGLGHPK
jgi:hypothetical protein